MLSSRRAKLALSRIRPGDEALGFAGALLAVGVRTITAAVTRVGDAAAAAMIDYHRRLANGATGCGTGRDDSGGSLAPAV